MRQLRIPFSIDRSGSVAFTENQSTVDRMNVVAVVGTEPRERTMRPTYGVRTRYLVFENGNDPILENELREEIVRQVESWEPEVSVSDIKTEFTSLSSDPEGSKYRVRVEYIPAAGRLSEEPSIVDLIIKDFHG